MTLREGAGLAGATDVTLREGTGHAGSADVTVREGVGGASATDATLREGSSTGTGQMNLVPGGLFLRYTLLAPLEVTSGEADLWFVRHDQTEYVLKLYRYGIEPKAVMTQKLQALAAQHVVKLEEHGKFGNRAYEVLEKIEHGDLRKLAKPVAAERLKEVLKELSEAVSHLHTEGILHRDLKPANVLMRSREPLELVLTDFGISSLNEGTMHLTNANRTASYSAPEALTGVVSAASDWWSVGVMVLELLKGVHPFAGKSEQVIDLQLVSKGIVIPAETAAEWAELLKGLLTRDHEKRWQGEQVAKWLTGARNQPTHYEGDRQQTHTHKPYQFGGKDIYTAKELAVALSEDWANGAKNFGRGFVSGWVERQLENQDLASRLLDVYEDKEISADEKLSAALVEMDRSLPAMWRGNVVNREWAAREPKGFQALLQSRVRPKLERQPGWPAELVKQLAGLKASKLSPGQLKSMEWLIITGEPLKTGDKKSEVVQLRVGDVECPHCSEGFEVSEGTGAYDCPHCGKEVELALSCPHCGEDELEVENWEAVSCPSCEKEIDAWAAAVVRRRVGDVECPHCSEGFEVSEGTGAYDCPHCGKEVELALSCPHCGEDELEVESWEAVSCPSCRKDFDAWAAAVMWRGGND